MTYDIVNKIRSKIYLYGIFSSEDIYWFLIGYCLSFKAVNKYHQCLDFLCFCENIERTLFKDLSPNRQFNLGMYYKMVTNTDLESLDFFIRDYEVFIDKGYFSTSQYSFSILKDLNEKKIDFVYILNFFSENEIEPIHIENILNGYDRGCIELNIKDAKLEQFIKHRSLYYEMVLDKLKMPAHLNLPQAISILYHTNKKEGIIYFRNEIGRLMGF